MSETTDKHFQVFTKWTEKFVSLFGLQGWKLGVFHRDLGDDRTAECRFINGNRVSDISLNTRAFETFTNEMAQEQAYHESLELLLAPCWNTATMAELGVSARRERLEEQTHIIIRTLENAYLPVHRAEMKHSKTITKILSEYASLRQTNEGMKDRIRRLERQIRDMNIDPDD